MIVFLTLVIGVVTVLYFYLRHNLNYWQNLGIPCIEPSLLLGNLSGVGDKIHNTINIQLIYEKFKVGNKLCGYYLLQSPCLIALDLDLIKNILIKDFNHFVDRGIFNNAEEDPLSGHLFAIEGDKWRSLRNKLSPTFTSGKMKMMYPIVHSYSQGLVDLVQQLSSNNVNGVNIKNVCTRFTADVIGSCGFGLECNALKDDNAEMLKMGELFDISDPWARFNFFFVNIFPNFAKKINMKVTPKFINDFFMPMIKQTHDYRMNNDVNRNDFMSLLIQIMKNGKLNDEEGVRSTETMTFNELAAQAFLFFVAGFETSSTTMTYALYELAYRPEIQEKLRKEIVEVEKKHNGEITYEAISEMTYLDQIVNGSVIRSLLRSVRSLRLINVQLHSIQAFQVQLIEIKTVRQDDIKHQSPSFITRKTLRMYSPIGQLFRTCLNDYKVPGTNFVIKKGISVFIPVHAIHHDSRFFYDPEVFNPDRFSSEEVKKRSHYSFLPFGEGPRNCIGMRFGLMQVKVGIATMIKNFKFSFHDNTTYPLWLDARSILMTSMHPINLVAEKV